MTYPQALLIAVVAIASAILVSQGLNAGTSNQGQVAISSVSVGGLQGGQVFVVRADGQVRSCFGAPILVKKQDQPSSDTQSEPLTDRELMAKLMEMERRQNRSNAEIAAEAFDVWVECSEWK